MAQKKSVIQTEARLVEPANNARVFVRRIFDMLGARSPATILTSANPREGYPMFAASKPAHLVEMNAVANLYDIDSEEAGDYI